MSKRKQSVAQANNTKMYQQHERIKKKKANVYPAFWFYHLIRRREWQTHAAEEQQKNIKFSSSWGFSSGSVFFGCSVLAMLMRVTLHLDTSEHILFIPFLFDRISLNGSSLFSLCSLSFEYSSVCGGSLESLLNT